MAALQIVDPGLQLQNLEMEMQEQDRRQGEKISEIKGMYPAMKRGRRWLSSLFPRSYPAGGSQPGCGANQENVCVARGSAMPYGLVTLTFHSRKRD